MPLKFACEACGAKLAVKDGAEGRRIKCPKCGAMIGVPAYPDRIELPIVVDPVDDFGLMVPLVRPGPSMAIAPEAAKSAPKRPFWKDPVVVIGGAVPTIILAVVFSFLFLEHEAKSFRLWVAAEKGNADRLAVAGQNQEAYDIYKMLVSAGDRRTLNDASLRADIDSARGEAAKLRKQLDAEHGEAETARQAEATREAAAQTAPTRDEFLDTPPERQLAILQAHRMVPPDDPLVSQIRSLIDKADALYKGLLSRICGCAACDAADFPPAFQRVPASKQAAVSRSRKTRPSEESLSGVIPDLPSRLHLRFALNLPGRSEGEGGRGVPPVEPERSPCHVFAPTDSAEEPYKEDHATIAKTTLLLWHRLQRAGVETNPTDLLEGSLTWIGPGYFKSGVPRKFSEYYAVYLTTRIGDGKDRSKFLGHKEALEATRTVAKALMADSDDEDPGEPQGGTDTKSLVDELQRQPPDVQLAILQATFAHKPVGPILEEVRTLLKKADVLYEEDEATIAHMTLKTWMHLRLSKSLTNANLILQGSLVWVRHGYFEKGVPRRYADYIAVYVTARLGDGKDLALRRGHKEAIEGMQRGARALHVDDDPEPSAKTARETDETNRDPAYDGKEP